MTRVWRYFGNGTERKRGKLDYLPITTELPTTEDDRYRSRRTTTDVGQRRFIRPARLSLLPTSEGAWPPLLPIACSTRSGGRIFADDDSYYIHNFPVDKSTENRKTYSQLSSVVSCRNVLEH